jgi:ADP-ribosyl-[dinitrogen reductase] hydrolase
VDKDLKILRDCYKTDLLVSLLEEHEFRVLGVPALRNRAEEHGIQVIWFPIAGRSVPIALKEFAVLVQRIINAMCSGKNAVIHCMGGRGRTGFVLHHVLWPPPS